MLDTTAIIVATVISVAVLLFAALARVMWQRKTARKGTGMPFSAMPPLASLECGVSAAYLKETFPGEAQAAAGKQNPNFYELCQVLAIGPHGKGFGKICPRDGRLNCSIVDALVPPQQGKATHFVSWCWQYSLDNVVDAIAVWLESSNQPAAAVDVYLWMCFFCNNQYRIMEEGSQTGSDELQDIFESHLASAGHMLVILDSFMHPHYFSRAWCLFETFVCIEQDFPRTILLPSGQLEEFRQVMETTGPSLVREKIHQIDLRRASASVQADEDTIKRMVYNSCGFDTLNHAVQRELLKWILHAFEVYMLNR